MQRHATPVSDTVSVSEPLSDSVCDCVSACLGHTVSEDSSPVED